MQDIIFEVASNMTLCDIVNSLRIVCKKWRKSVDFRKEVLIYKKYVEEEFGAWTLQDVRAAPTWALLCTYLRKASKGADCPLLNFRRCVGRTTVLDRRIAQDLNVREGDIFFDTKAGFYSICDGGKLRQMSEAEEITLCSWTGKGFVHNVIHEQHRRLMTLRRSMVFYEYPRQIYCFCENGVHDAFCEARNTGTYYELAINDTFRFPLQVLVPVGTKSVLKYNVGNNFVKFRLAPGSKCIGKFSHSGGFLVVRDEVQYLPK